MPDLRLTTVIRTQANTRALKEGVVAPERSVLAFEEVPVIVDAFRRMVRGLEFDVCEMAVTTYLCAREHGKPFTALPVFPVRAFHHGAILRGAAAGVRHPKDLEGGRVGVSRGYTVTTGVWARGILHDEYGVDPAAVTWVPSGDEHVAEYRPPRNVEPMPAGTSLAELIASGELAAVVGAGYDTPGAEPLIPDAEQAGFAALRGRGHYPVNHLVVVRDELLGAHPDLAADLFTAFATAKDLYVRRLRDGAIEEPDDTDRRYRRVMDITGRDPLPYGVAPNRAVLEELIGHAARQGILTTRPTVESLFAEGTLDLVG